MRPRHGRRLSALSDLRAQPADLDSRHGRLHRRRLARVKPPMDRHRRRADRRHGDCQRDTERVPLYP